MSLSLGLFGLAICVLLGMVLIAITYEMLFSCSHRSRVEVLMGSVAFAASIGVTVFLVGIAVSIIVMASKG